MADGYATITGSALDSEGKGLVVGKDYSDGGSYPWIDYPIDVPPSGPPPGPDGTYAHLLEGGVRQYDIYVDAAVGSRGDGCSWESPFKSIQEAVDAVRLDGSTIHVRPGVYGPVEVDKSRFTLNGQTNTFRVESTEGADKTAIDGGEVYQMSQDVWVGDSSHCFGYPSDYYGPYDTVKGFTLRDASEGGSHGRYECCVVSNCSFGLYVATGVNSLLVNNGRAGAGGGELYNCTIAASGLGVTVTSKMVNTILLKDNEADCAMMQSAFVDAANGDYHLKIGSPYINAGVNAEVVGGLDLDGKPRQWTGESILLPIRQVRSRRPLPRHICLR